MSNNPSTIPRGNIINHWVIAATLSPTSVAPNTSAEQTFTVPGLRLGDFIDVNKPTTQAGLGLNGSRVSAKETLALNFGNNSAATITPTASEVYTILISRPDNLTAAGVSLLTVPA